MPASFASSRPALGVLPVIRWPRPDRGPKDAAAPTSDLSDCFFYFPMVRRTRWNGRLLFHRAMKCATVSAWPAPPLCERPAHLSSLKRCLASLGRFPVGLPNTTSRRGVSPTTGPIPFRSHWRKSMCSSAGSAISSTSCFPRPSRLTLRRLP